MRLVLASVLVTGALAGCIEDQLIRCGDFACPSTTVCTPGGCATPEAATACLGLVDGDMCMTPLAVGACRQGACYAVVCGDSLREGSETCDDGNTTAGDGCSPLCDSTEVCGNGVIDPVGGEECDDGTAFVSGDGCSSRCRSEVPMWIDRSPAPIAGRWDHGMAYDSARDRIVVFGGTTADEYLGDTWEWDGVRWQRMQTLVSPPARATHAMTYDARRREVVLFGGTGASGALVDTWTWDGTTWTEHVVANSPPPGTLVPHMWMVFDAARHVAVLVVSTNSLVGSRAETWEWDGTSWTQRLDVGSPPGTLLASLAYDATRGEVVHYGGRYDSATTVAERFPRQTWVFNGVSWQERVGSAPDLTIWSAMGFDSTRGRVVLFGGFDASSLSDKTWEWNGATWANVTPLSSPPPRRSAAMAPYSPALGEVILFGGWNGFNDTWRWDGTTWTESATAPASPPPRSGGVMAYDRARGSVWLFGGPLDSADLWQWRDRAWSNVIVFGGAGPSARDLHAMAYDGSRDRLVVFGGRDGNTNNRLGDTWEWSGTAWTQATPAMSPSPRSGVTMTFDDARDVIVLFGGRNTAGMVTNETWTWNGSTWTLQQPSAAPPARTQAALTYDAVRERVVLFGGTGTAGELGDTWEWDGTTWSDRTASGPRPRVSAAMTYDAQRRRVLLFGGGTSTTFGDTWEWDGTMWTPLVTSGAPQVRSGASIAFDAIARETVVFGGSGLAGPRDDTWLFRYAAPLRASERCAIATEDLDGDERAGCDDPDCWGRCAPQCPPGTSCAPSAARCGDAVCSAVEDALLCPTDCL